MATNIQPGMLCLVTQGLEAGQTVTTIRELSILNMEKITGIGLCHDGVNTFWEIDTLLTLKNPRTKQKVKWPICINTWLLPIPPLADDQATTQTRELEHS